MPVDQPELSLALAHESWVRCFQFSVFMLLLIAIMMPAYIMTRRHVHD